MPLVVVELFPIDFERSTRATSSGERQLTLAQVRADHVRHVRVLSQKDQTGSRLRPKLNIQAVPARHIQSSLHCVSEKNVTFYICYNLNRCHPILPFFWPKHTARNLEQTQATTSRFICSYVRTVPCKF